MAKKIAGDGEGATALFEVKIVNAQSKEQAVTLAKSIVTSSLTKQQSTDMMLTGEESFVQWDIQQPSLILKK